MCTNCTIKPVFTQISGRQLCKSCFLRYVEHKVRKTIRTYSLIQNGDRIAIAVSGGKDSLTVLDILSRIYKDNTTVEISALLINEGIEGYRDKAADHAHALCTARNITLTQVSYKEVFGFALDNVVQGRKPCSVCGVLRRKLLNSYARKMGATKLATGHNLDDEAQNILMNQFRSSMDTSARLGPITGIADHTGFVRRIKPLYFLTEKEVMTYAYLKGLVDDFNECPYNKESYRNKVREMLNGFEEQFPGTKHALIRSFLEILPLLKKGMQEKKKNSLRQCAECGDPCSGERCQACNILKQLKAPEQPL